jgi:hypothetical protein
MPKHTKFSTAPAPRASPSQLLQPAPAVRAVSRTYRRTSMDRDFYSLEELAAPSRTKTKRRTSERVDLKQCSSQRTDRARPTTGMKLMTDRCCAANDSMFLLPSAGDIGAGLLASPETACESENAGCAEPGRFRFSKEGLQIKEYRRARRHIASWRHLRSRRARSAS